MTEAKKNAGIIGLGSAVPDNVVTNFDLEKIVETSNEWIVERTGIVERRIAKDGVGASDLAYEASSKALKHAGLEAGDIDLIIVATFTGDTPLPATACILQDRLGAAKAAAFDLAAGCSGFVYAIAVADGLVRAGAYEKILVVGVDLLSRVTNWTDRTTCVLFGDGAGAAVVSSVNNGNKFLSFVLGSDGSRAEALKIDAGGSKLPASAETVAANQHGIYMNGREVFKFAVRIMEDATIEALQKAGLTPEDIDLFIPHQANIRIVEAATRRLNLPSEKVFVNVQNYGNTSAASVPLALDEAYAQGRLKEGDIVVMVGFGAGLTWAASVIRWGLGGR